MLCRANVYPMIGALCLLTSLCVVGLGPATASPAPSVCISAHPALTDVDGDGASDVVVGRPATSGSVVGAVDIHGTRSGSKVISGSGFTGASRAFGSSVVELRVDEDEFTCVDALVGDPGATGGGSVYLLRGTSAGLSTTSTRLTARTTGDRFGAAIAVGPGANADVWVGAPNRTVAGVREAGAVDHWTINDSGAATYLETITEASPVSHGVLTADAHFGAVLSASTRAVMVGTPDDVVDGKRGAGSATALYVQTVGSPVTSGTRLTQDSPGIAGTPETGDHFGAAVLSGQAIGVPDEDIGSVVDAGMVQLLGSSDRAFDQNSPGVPGTAEAGDQFGASLGSYGGEAQSGIVVGGPGEGLNGAAHAGAIYVYTVDITGVDHWTGISQGTAATSVGSTPEANDRFGQTLSVTGGNVADEYDLSQTLIGVPGEDIGAADDTGLLTRLTPAYLPATHLSFGNIPSNTTGARYGSVIAIAPTLDCAGTFCFLVSG